MLAAAYTFLFNSKSHWLDFKLKMDQSDQKHFETS